MIGRLRLAAALVVVGAFSACAAADGMIVPIRPEIRVRSEWAVKFHHVKITVRDQVAAVTVDQEFVNTGRGMIEVEYFFPVPPDAAVDSMTLVVDGKEFAGKMYKADEARKIYEDIVRKKKDPALLEYVGFGLFKTSAFPLQPDKPMHVIVTYKTICKKDRNVVEVWYPLNTEKFSAKAIEDVEVKVDIKSKADITSVYSPSHDIRKEQPDPRQVIVTYRDKKVLPTGDFQVFYREADEEVGATLLTYWPEGKGDGYFMLLASPSPRGGRERVTPKDIVLALDHSGSMSGEKIEQACNSLRYVLRNLNPDDNFNVILFSDSVEPLFDMTVPADKKHLEEALDRVDRIEATGGTALYAALQAAMECTARPRGKDDGRRTETVNRPAYVVLLTDGRPTIGKTAEADIIGNTARANECKARLFAFGVGYDVNVRLLDKLAQENQGRTEYVKPKEDIESKVSSFYAKIKNPVMTDLKVSVDGLRLRDVYPRELPDLFEGDQVVVVGRCQAQDTDRRESAAGLAKLLISGQYLGRERTFEYGVAVARERRSTYAFVEKLWAVRRVGYLLDEIALHGKNQELIDELVRLGKDYGIMTPYTSFLAEEDVDLRRPEVLRRRADESVRELSEVEGATGQRGAVNRQVMKQQDRAGESVLSADALSAAAAGGRSAGPSARPAAAPVQGYQDKGSYEAGKTEAVANVQNVGNQTLYRRGQRWITPQTAGLDDKKDADKIKVVERYSQEYFDLAAKNTPEENQVLAAQGENEELLVELRGQAYLIK